MQFLGDGIFFDRSQVISIFRYQLWLWRFTFWLQNSIYYNAKLFDVITDTKQWEINIDEVIMLASSTFGCQLCRSHGRKRYINIYFRIKT